MNCSILSILCACLCTLSAHAKLTFDSQKKEFIVKPDATEIDTIFHFQNTSDKPVRITKHDAPCTCLEAEILPKKYTTEAIPPGGKGTVRTKFSVSNFSGTTEKSVALFLDDDSNKPSTFLVVSITIPVYFEINPKTLKWDATEEPKAKKFTINVNHDQPINITNTTATNKNFTYDITTLKEGFQYEVTVTPQKQTPGFGILRFKTDSKIKRFKTAQAFLVMARPRNKAK